MHEKGEKKTKAELTDETKCLDSYIFPVRHEKRGAVVVRLGGEVAMAKKFKEQKPI